MIALFAAALLETASGTVVYIPPRGSEGRWGANRSVVERALAAPERPATGKPQRRFCFIDTITSAEPRKVCRTRGQWNNLGLDPITD